MSWSHYDSTPGWWNVKQEVTDQPHWSHWGYWGELPPKTEMCYHRRRAASVEGYLTLNVVNRLTCLDCGASVEWGYNAEAPELVPMPKPPLKALERHEPCAIHPEAGGCWCGIEADYQKWLKANNRSADTKVVREMLDPFVTDL